MTTVIVKETGIQVVTVGTQGPSGTGGGGGGGNGDMAVATYDPASKAEQVLTISDMLDEDDFSSNSETKAPTQQSVKVYVDNGLAEKASASHTHTLSDLTDAGSMAAESADDYYTSAEVDSALGSKADSSHTHAINEVTGLQSALDAKASAAHTHTLSDVTDAGSMAAESADDYYTSAEVDSALDSYVASDNTGVTGADKVGNIMTLTQSEYNAITPISDTLYFVTV